MSLSHQRTQPYPFLEADRRCPALGARVPPPPARRRQPPPVCRPRLRVAAIAMHALWYFENSNGILLYDETLIDPHHHYYISRQDPSGT
jgi:hypothetical protein